jgi:urease beta subunit
MTVEAVVPVDGTATATVEAMGFEAVGSGPRIDGASTTRYRFDPGENGDE